MRKPLYSSTIQFDASLRKNIIVSDKIGVDRHIKIAPFRKEIRTTQPHRHNQYFEIVFLSKGKGSHWIDGTQYEVKTPVIFFINRNQIHNWQLTDDPEGYVIILKNSFLQQSRDESLKQLLYQLWHANCLYLQNVEEFDVLFRLLATQTMTTIYQYHILDGLLKALVGSIIEKGKQNFIHSGLQIQLYSRYIDLLLTEQPIQRKVAYFAGQLRTTPQNLNAACRKAVNQTASEILDNFVVDEARRLLLFTDNSVNEIAYALSFKDPSYFVKFFKRLLDITPEEFRKRNFQNHLL